MAEHSPKILACEAKTTTTITDLFFMQENSCLHACMCTEAQLAAIGKPLSFKLDLFAE